MNYREMLERAFCTGELDVLQTNIGGRYIVWYGIVKQVVGDGVVRVVNSASAKASDCICVDCILVNTASSSLTLNIIPNENDKVLVISPRNYSDDMFDLDRVDPIIEDYLNGYTPCKSMAILCNQFKEGGHNNSITFDNGKIEAKLAYDTENKVHNLLFSTNENGELSLSLASLNDDYQAKLNIDKSGKLSYQNPKATVSVNEDGSFSVENENTTVTIESGGNISIETKGKFTFKNNTTDLKTVLVKLKEEIDSLITVGSPATQKTSPATQGKLATWLSSQLDQLLE